MTSLRFAAAASIALVVVLAALCCSGAAVTAAKHGDQHQQSQVAPVFVTASATLFDKLSATLVPLINAFARNLTVPAQSTAHFNFSSFQLKEFDIALNLFDFVPPNGLKMNILGLSLATPHIDFVVFDKIVLELKCSGQFWARTADASAWFVLPIVRSPATGTMSVGNITQQSVSVGSLVVNHTLESTICEAAQWVVQLFIGNINRVIEDVVQKQIGPMIASVATDLLSGIFAKIPLKIVADPSVDPSIDAMTVAYDLLDLLPMATTTTMMPQRTTNTRHETGKQKPLDHHQPLLVLDQRRRRGGAAKPQDRQHRRSSALASAAVAPPPLPATDISVRIPQRSVNVALEHMARRRALDFVNISLPSTTTQFLRAFIPQAFALCPYCPLVIDLISMPPAAATAAAAAASSDPPGAYSYGPPRVVFSSNNASIVIDGSFMRVSAVPRPNATAKRARGAPPRPIELFSLALYAEGGLYNFSIVQSLLQLVTLVHFDLQPLSNVAVTVKTSRVGKIHVGLLGKAVAHLMNTLVIPLINDVFPGIPVLKLGNVTLSQPYVSVGAGEMVLGVDVALPVV